ncbi:hypothetical protein Noc_2745 [Nitrosococcus oceani ATCC 19707]|uniref:Uncharacterized protein n=1 Tax=Nitrosococcus oceani (strain ATCC 19707 / BCRC 17464 / JCM 30415 / NCIMB 11848 / C-107) TaxID=323261 RepID=Q3J7K0_NITOC|nr:hypothetical protein [Nitrosococcus oceani]ABA59196.1 hypothetical protein Noc_2745 [Nitrosococcus oceani ATCC 19707]
MLVVTFTILVLHEGATKYHRTLDTRNGGLRIASTGNHNGVIAEYVTKDILTDLEALNLFKIELNGSPANKAKLRNHAFVRASKFGGDMAYKRS